MPAIDVVGKQYDRLKVARRQREAEHRVALNREMDALTAEFDALVLRATNEGATVAKVAREMGASRTTVYAILDRAEGVKESASTTIYDPLSERYKLDGDALRVILKADELEPYLGRLGWSHADLATRPELRQNYLTPITTPDGRTILEPKEDFMPADGKRHPVAAWLDKSENETEALAWFAAHKSEGGSL